METFIIIMVIGLVGGTTAAYFFLLFYYTDWVCITGKSAHKTLAEHQEGSHVDDSDILT
jgi:hypothetical protein